MNPTRPTPEEIALKELEDVTPILDEVTEKAITLARDFFEARDEPINSYLFPCLVRYFAKTLLDLPEYRSVGYYVVDISNNGLFIVYLKKGKTRKIRILKSDEGSLPVYNLSKKKKEFYSQPLPLFALLPNTVTLEEFVSPDLVKYVALWDVDRNYVFTGMKLVCTKNENGDAHFVGTIPHAATTITTSGSFDEEPEELDDIDIEPLERTGTGDENDGNGDE
jgi:hypothetical protein